MSLDKAIKHKKEHRKPFRGAKAYTCACRNHGTCSWCIGNRTLFDAKARAALDGQEEEFYGYWFDKDPSDVVEEQVEEGLKQIGEDPNDFTARGELDV